MKKVRHNPALNMDHELQNLFVLLNDIADIDLQLAAIRRRCIAEHMAGNVGLLTTSAQLISKMAKDLVKKEKENKAANPFDFRTHKPEDPFKVRKSMKGKKK